MEDDSSLTQTTDVLMILRNRLCHVVERFQHWRSRWSSVGALPQPSLVTMPMNSRQYEERINKLEAALEMARLRYQSQSSRMKTFEDENKKLKEDITTERAELEALLSNRQVNILLESLKEERTQRLVEMEAAHIREREMKALSNEAAVATKGALLAHEEAAGKRAEVNGLRASLRVSTKLLTIAEKDFQATHKELEATQLQLLETRRKLMLKTDEVNVWTDRYNQAMIDLHMAQMKLTQVSVGASAKESALMRGYGVVIAEAAGEPVSIQRQPFLSAKRGRLFVRVDWMLPALHEGTAKFNGVQADRAMARYNLNVARSESEPALGSQHARRRRVDRVALAPCTDPEMSQETPQSAPAKAEPPNHPGEKKSILITTHFTSTRDAHGSKYLGYGLGMLKKDNVVADHRQERAVL
ncbi:hypothetical protein H310_06278 [Aphanomyces invadans]|uniref:Uncharacterized protein n=1 Tax=Aphanomyces invadans TaxID=157072 RepID=A0A024U7R0_9STRA|nr:hypothetical protein H310_06278 [Aphanomyces invadans]ETW01653.1 hypothetical protein H310_06278 [Aphanomyces invadans]|eukprot:XP_008869501.1 hypothetical protein H310_06278 [Aphanomyces invadans]